MGIHDPDQTVDSAAATPVAGGAEFPPPGAAPAADLAAAARGRMEAEWERGNRIPAEWFLDRAPTLAGDPAALDVIFLEFVLREEAGERPTVEAFAARFPRLERPLRTLLQLDSALGTAATTDQPGSAPTFREGGGAAAQSSDTVASGNRPPPAADHHPAPPGAAPAAIGRYLVVEALKGGGQADVFVGFHPGLAREVVIKRLRGATVGDDESARLTTEGRVLASMEHPHLARVYDLDVDAGRPFMVMESIRGRNLADLVKHAPVAPADAALWVAAVGRAAGYAHARGVLHLDIKPRNIVLEDTGRAVLIDFGLARVERGLPAEGDTGVSGTLAYMPPEQARGDNHLLGPQADVYGLGGVLYYLLVGKDPVRGATGSELYAAAKAGRWDRDDLRRCGPPALVAVCERALDPDPAKRFPDGAAFAAAVEAAAAPPRRTGRRNVLIACAGAALLLGAVAVAAWLPRDRDPEPAQTPPPVQPAPAQKLELRFVFDVLRGRTLHSDFPSAIEVGDRARIKATIPAGQHATLILVTESGPPKVLFTAPAQAADHTFHFPPSANLGNPELMRFTSPIGTHGFLLASSPAGPVTPEQLGLKDNPAWPRIAYDVVIRLAEGRVRREGTGRDIELGGTVADPEGVITTELERIISIAPARVTLEGVVFSVKNK